ncbi:flagellar basal body L-ring protein FlgH [Vibrio sp. D431a]|uniref:flagellar basal body L-ring protein FlgH n=1 Tax=Vibrio sp. D431a TaxID=2837388 RepID=UPI002554DA07|nr:flagellar basal body L-ring protein FlgH [Vibrio sp. D431a]MDK9793911.1 flagellar basal body L-ring protein FlgH [Vibrio sp. D431a]
MKYAPKLLGVALLAALTGCSSTPEVPTEKEDLKPFEVGEIEYNSTSPVNGSIFGTGQQNMLIGVGHRYQIGDLVIVNMEEAIDAKDSINTKTKSKTQNKAGANAGISLFGEPKMDGSINYTSDKKADGSGSTAQSHSLSGSIACTVTKVYPNGVLEIKGTKQLTLEKGTETIALVGHIKEQDISTTNNTINSSRIANARIYYRGDGYIYDKATEGWFSNFVTGKYWPF